MSLEERVGEDVVRLFLAHWRGSLGAVSLLTLAAASAGRGYVSTRTATVWCALACLNYIAQAFVCWRLEQAPSLAAVMPRWMPWLLASGACSSMVWGSVPWVLSSAATPVQLLANLFNLMLFFSAANAPATRMMLFAVLPLAVLTILALAVRDGMPYIALGSMVAFGLVLLYGLRVQAAVQETQKERHAAKDLTEELRSQQQRLVKVENERTLLIERQRLMRDMHDGMGSTLLSSLTMVEQGQLDSKAVAALLRECMDDLRLVVDSLEPLDHDLVAVLATLRYRLEPRLASAGIHLEWVMSDLPPLQWLRAPQALQVLRIMQEVLANVIKHAQARQVRITAQVDAASPLADSVLVQIEDDGIGFDTEEVAPGRGLRHLQHRAAQLGGRVEIDSSASKGTCVSLRLQVVTDSPAA